MHLLSGWLNSVKTGDTFHAVLLAGPTGTGKKALARRAAALFLTGSDDTAALAECPYFMEWAPREEGGKKVYADAVRECCEFLQKSTFASGRHCVLFPDLHLLNAVCQNALLKTLEEPPENSLLLITGNEENILPTIRSRCMTLRLGATSREETEATLLKQGTDPKLARLAACWSDGITERALEMVRTDYAAFKAEAVRLFTQTLFGLPPYEEALRLCTEQKKASAEKVGMLLELACGLLRDAQAGLWGVCERLYPDEEALTARIAAGFTRARIRLMMQFTLASLETLAMGGGPKPVLDEWLTNVKTR